MDILILLSLCLLSCRDILGQHDHETTVEKVKLGQRVMLPCTALSNENSGNSKLQWLFDNKGHHHKVYTIDASGEVSEESELKKRVHLENNSTLVISDVQIQDEKLFICHVEKDGKAKESRIQLRVYKAPGEPEITMEGDGFLVDDTAVQIGSCESKNGFPTPNITWYKNDSPLRNGQNGVKVNSQVTVESSGLITVMSMLYSPVEKSDADALLFCEVSYHLPKGVHMKESQKKNITVYYTNTEVRLFTKNEKIKEGDFVELICEGNGNPQPETTLYKKDHAEPLATNRWNVSRKDSGGYHCSALDLNQVVSLEADTEIQVHFLDPPVLSEESPVAVALGSVLNVFCQANASVQTEIQWRRDGITIENGPVLNITLSDYHNGGHYVCVVDLPSVPELTVNKELQVIVKGKPHVAVIQHQMQNGVSAKCTAIGFPLPQIAWYINGSKVNTQNEDLSNISDYEVVSELLITQDLNNENLTCEAVNKFGSSTDYYIPLLEIGIATTNSFDTNSESGATVIPITNAGSRSDKSYGVVIVAVIVCILLLAILGAVLYFLYKKGRIPCGRSGKQDITKPGDKDKIVVEMKPDSPAEESVLLPGPQEKMQPGNQEKYMDLRN